MSLFNFTERYLTSIGKSLKNTAMSHVVPVGCREVTVAFDYIVERAIHSEGLHGLDS